MRAVFAYIPVIHAGTLTFLDQYREIPILLLDNETGKRENPYLERDIRALSAQEVCIELKAHGFHTAEVAVPSNLKNQLEVFEELIVPEDEIVDFFLEKYSIQSRIHRVKTFLRWTKQISTDEHTIPPDREISSGEFEKQVLATLNVEAQRSPDWWRQIAAAIVIKGEVVAMAHNKHFPSAHALTINGDPRSNLDAGQGPGVYTSIHAEACVLAHAARKGIAVEGADMYVTTFPCPVCARSVVEAGIVRIFYQKGYSLLDAEEILRNAGISIMLVREDR